MRGILLKKIKLLALNLVVSFKNDLWFVTKPEVPNFTKIKNNRQLIFKIPPKNFHHLSEKFHDSYSFCLACISLAQYKIIVILKIPFLVINLYSIHPSFLEFEFFCRKREKTMSLPSTGDVFSFLHNSLVPPSSWILLNASEPLRSIKSLSCFRVNPNFTCCSDSMITAQKTDVSRRNYTPLQQDNNSHRLI